MPGDHRSLVNPSVQRFLLGPSVLRAVELLKPFRDEITMRRLARAIRIPEPCQDDGGEDLQLAGFFQIPIKVCTLSLRSRCRTAAVSRSLAGFQ